MENALSQKASDREQSEYAGQIQVKGMVSVANVSHKTPSWLQRSIMTEEVWWIVVENGLAP